MCIRDRASRSGDRIQSEYYYQFTDHYYRIMVELGINIEENTNFDDHKQNTANEQTSDIDNETIEVNDNDKAEDDSIESIPFIAEPSKEKRTRSTK